MASLRAESAVPGGTPVTSITLVCPTREAALALEPRARSHGPTSWLTNRWPDQGDSIRIEDLDWRLSLELQGIWRVRRVELEMWTRTNVEAHSASFYIDWEGASSAC